MKLKFFPPTWFPSQHPDHTCVFDSEVACESVATQRRAGAHEPLVRGTVLMCLCGRWNVYLPLEENEVRVA